MYHYLVFVPLALIISAAALALPPFYRSCGIQGSGADHLRLRLCSGPVCGDRGFQLLR